MEEFDPEELSTNIQANPEVAIPVGFFDFRLDSVLNDSTDPDLLQIHPDGRMTVTYRQDIFSDTLTNIFNIQDVSFEYSFHNPLPSLPLWTGAEATLPASFPLTLNDTLETDIDSIWVSSMSISLNIEGIRGMKGAVELSSDSIRKGRKPFYHEVRIEDGRDTIRLEGYTVHAGNNRVDITADITIDPGLEYTARQGELILGAECTIFDASYEAIFGFLGNFNVSLPLKTTGIDFFNNTIDGSFHFERPVLKIYYSNTIGIPVRISLDEFFFQTRQGEVLDIRGDELPVGGRHQLITHPEAASIRRNDTSGRVAYDSLVLDLNRTNLIELLGRAPTSIGFSATGEINPPGVDSVNFITDNSHYSADMFLTLPLKGYTQRMEMIDTLPFDFSRYYNKPPEELKRLIFRINFINGFPVELDAQVYFADENYQVLTPLFDSTWNLVSAGIPSEDQGCEIRPYVNRPLNIEFPDWKIRLIGSSKYIIAHARINTPGAGLDPPRMVTFCNDHFFKAYLGVIVDAEINSSDY